MSTEAESQQLDPQVLDGIVQELNLREASALERMQLWYRDFLNTAWDWLKAFTGGDDGWLEKAADWVTHWLSGLDGGSPISADGIVNGITLVTVALIVFGLGLLGYRLWQLYRPLASNQPTNLSYLLDDPELKRPLAELRPDQWAPALLSQVCISLVEQGRLQLHPHSTNVAIADAADLPGELQADMRALANAADRSLFAGWVPNSQDAIVLRKQRSKIIDSLVAAN